MCKVYSRGLHVYLHLPSFIIMEFVTTKRGARAIVYEGQIIGEDEMVVSSGGVGEVAAAVDLSALFKCVFTFKTLHKTVRNVFFKSRRMPLFGLK